MRRKIFTTFICLASSLWASAAPVGPSTAKDAATKFLNKHRVSATSLQSVQLPDSLGFYAFNVGGENGFVLIASDNSVSPIIGYSTTGHFEWEELPFNAKNWMQGYRKGAITEDAESTATNAWNNLLEGKSTNQPKAFAPAVEPLCKANWYQLDYYNAKCPTAKGKDQAVTGCVATAMGIIMKYWNYPACGKGSISYTDSNYGPIDADFSQSYYDWDNMPETLDENSTPAEVDAVATLLADCAFSIHSEFGDTKEGTAATLICAEPNDQETAEYALKTFFGYDGSKIKSMVRNNFFDNTWKLYLKNELNEGRPIIYDGASTGDGLGGHCFVCDGYDADGLFHFNWGWNGSANGYFSIDAMTPVPGFDFNHSQEALIGITPPPSYFSVENTFADGLQVYPNPATDVLHIKLPEGAEKCTYTLTNSCGQKVRNAEAAEILSIAGLTPGIYMLQVMTCNKTYKRQIIIK
ncbi:MAG: thiol protease/hemagglutinin PrtT [Paludibacteraceae bacterium]|nr:thiol protease/hemagglutinin PrtT [Paludibacteraceae bacterium]